MFFMLSINDKIDEIYTDENVRVCKACGKYGRYSLLMKYRRFSLFFIPIFKFHREYFVKSSCCDTYFTIDEEVAYDIASGRKTFINDEDIDILDYKNGASEDYIKTCGSCGYQTYDDFKYCPKCGDKL